MTRQISFEWEHVEAHEYDERTRRERSFLSRRGIPGVRVERQVALWSLRGVALIIVILLATTSSSQFAQYEEQIGLHRSIQFALELEERAWRNDDRELFESLIDENVESYWRREWRNFWYIEQPTRDDLGTTVIDVEAVALPDNGETAQEEAIQEVGEAGDVVMATVLITRPATEWWRSSPYRETRFYRRTGLGWKRTLPPEYFWGSHLVLERGLLRFEYRERNGVAVAVASESLEQFYADLYRVLTDATPSRRLTFILSPYESGRYPRFESIQEVASPTLSKVPDTMTDGEFLAHIAASQLTSLAVDDILRHSGRVLLNHWDNMVWAFNGWLRTELLGLRSPWHLQAESHFRTEVGARLPLTLAEITTWEERPVDQEAWMMNYFIAESVITYGLETYGRERLPAVLDGFTRHLSWEDYTLSVFGVSVDEFEQGWNEYLLKKYVESE